MSTLPASNLRVGAFAENVLNDLDVMFRLVPRNKYISSFELRIIEELRPDFA